MVLNICVNVRYDPIQLILKWKPTIVYYLVLINVAILEMSDKNTSRIKLFYFDTKIFKMRDQAGFPLKI